MNFFFKDECATANLTECPFYERKNVIECHTCWKSIGDILEEFTLRSFPEIYRFLPVLTEILEKIHFFSFYTAFYAPIRVKNIVFNYESNL